MQTTQPIDRDYPPRFPRLYRLKRGLTIAGLILIGVALAGELVLLLLGMGGGIALLMLFTAALAIPLVIGSVLTPPLVVTETGLVIRPMIGGPHAAPWESIRALRPYTLQPVDEPVAQILVGRANMPSREGRWILFSGGLPVTFRLAAWLTGLGGGPVIAISDATHANYAELLAAMESHLAPTTGPELAE